MGVLVRGGGGAQPPPVLRHTRGASRRAADPPPPSYRIGPYLGATAAALCYTYLLLPQVEEHPLKQLAEEDDTPVTVVATKGLPAAPPRAEALAVPVAATGSDGEWK